MYTYDYNTGKYDEIEFQCELVKVSQYETYSQENFMAYHGQIDRDKAKCPVDKQGDTQVC